MAERALVVYIGKASRKNFPVGLEHETWGFKTDHPDYKALQPGDWIVFGVGSNGSPRSLLEDWWKYTVAEVVVGRLTNGLYRDATPLWPNEGGDVSYPFRVTFEYLERFTNVPLAPGMLGPSLSDGLRKAGLRGQGVVVPADGGIIERLRNEVPVAVRPAGNVWMEIRDKCRERLVSGTPILTLEREVPNHIVAVEDDRIVRLSDEARIEGEPSAAPRTEVERLWDQLVQHGEVLTSEAHVLRFTQALVGRLIDGVGFDRDSRRLYFTDRVQAMRRWVSPPIPPVQDEPPVDPPIVAENEEVPTVEVEQLTNEPPVVDSDQALTVLAGSFDDLTLELVRQYLDIRQLRLGAWVRTGKRPGFEAR
jgi:hypothetical protein